MHGRFSHLGRLTALLALGGVILCAQDATTGAISGTVTAPNGTPAAGAKIILDGGRGQVVRVTDANGAGYGASGSYSIVYGSLGTGIHTDFISEAQIKSFGMDAEFGGATGGMVNAVTKTGGNTLHAQVFAYFGLDSLQAKDKVPPRIAPTLRLTPSFDSRDRYEVGSTISGPIIKDRLFITRDPDGDGRNKIYAFYGKYFEKVPLDLAVRSLSTEIGVSRSDFYNISSRYNGLSNRIIYRFVGRVLEDLGIDGGHRPHPGEQRHAHRLLAQAQARLLGLRVRGEDPTNPDYHPRGLTGDEAFASGPLPNDRTVVANGNLMNVLNYQTARGSLDTATTSQAEA